MKTIRTPLRSAATAAAALLLVLSGPAGAQSAGPTPAERKELDAAQAELRRAAERVAELSRKYREDGAERGGRELMRRPVLGVLLSPDPHAGVRIAGVTPDSAAAEAGLRSGDRLLAIGGKQILGSDGPLRVDNARKLLGRLQAGTPITLAYERAGRRTTVEVAPRQGSRALLLAGDDLVPADFDIDHEAIRTSVNDAMRAASKEMARVNQEILRLGDCDHDAGDKRGKNAPCRFPALAEAFRWSGLNLAAVGPQLGRYFGTERGVLVLSTGDELAGLQPGDVVQKIDGRTVGTPRDAMAVLRSKPAGSQVRVDYLRDRKPATAQVRVPEATPFRIPAPPAPPAPPRPPRAPDAPHAAPAAPPPPAPPREAALPPRPPAAPDAPEPPWIAGLRGTRDANTAGERRLVFVDDDGSTMVLEGDDAPPPPAPPVPPPLPRAPGD